MVFNKFALSFNEQILPIGTFCHRLTEWKRVFYSSRHSVFYYIWLLTAVAVSSVSISNSTLTQTPNTHPAYPDINILESNSRGITIEYRLKDVQYDTVTIDDTEYTGILYYGSQSPERTDPAYPDLKYRAVTIALPSTGAPSIEVMQKDYHTVRGIRVPPLGDIYKDEDDEMYLTANGLDIQTEIDQPLVDIHDISAVRNVVLGTLHIHPVQLERDGNTVNLHNRIIVRISFDSGSFGTIDEYTHTILRNTVLNINQVSVSPEARLRMEGVRGAPVSHQNSLLHEGQWYRISVEEEGMYRINRAVLEEAGIPVNQIDPRTIKMYSHGGKKLPESITQDRPEDLVEIAIYVRGEEDGEFNAGDYIVFYGTGTTTWEYDPDNQLFHHRYNYYVEENTYFVTYGGEQGRRMQTVPSLDEQNPIRPDHFIASLVYRDPKINLLDSGREWIGESFSPGNVSTFPQQLHGFTPQAPTRYRIQVAARAPSQTNFSIEDQGVSLGAIPVSGVNLGTITGNYAARSATTMFTRSGSFPDDRSALRFQYNAGAQSEGFLEWFEIHYPRSFQAEDDHLVFTAPDTTGVVEFAVEGFTSSQITAYEVTDYTDVNRITENIEGAAIRFQSEEQRGAPGRYAAAAPNGYRSIETIEPIENSNLRGIAEGAEFIIVAHPHLVSEAERLKQHRESFTENSLSTIVVDVKSIYNEFSGGLVDPTAIRDFLSHAYESWQVTPRYVLLFGSGSYDYREYLGYRRNYVPTWQTNESFSQINTYTTDDFFVQFTDGSRRPSLSIGRLNAINEEDARVMVDKIINYETKSDPGAWRNLVTYIADNGLTTRGGNEGNLHTWQSEQLARDFTPAAFEKEKIYAIEYPIENTATGRRQPEVNKEIVRTFNEGSLIINWTGHGNPRVWAHEWIFVKETTIPQLNNRNRLSFVTAATCDFSRFDDPSEQSVGELLVSREEGGTIGLLSSSRIVWSSDNAQFNNRFYQNLLNPLNDGTYPRVGDALFATKQVRHGVNDIKFVLLGDPTVRLQIPKYNASVTKINDEPVDETVMLKALQKVTIDGTINKPDGSLNEDFDGRMFVSVYDSDKVVSVTEWGGWSFTISGNVIFRGESSINRGRYSSSFVVPKDISHEGREGRIALYFWEDNSDGRGFSRDIVLGGIDTTVTPDTEGPEITMYLDDRNFRSGDLVSEHPLLLVDLFDESGINISGGGVGHRIEAWHNDGESIDLTDYYTGAVDSYQEGSIEYQMDELESGPHHLKMRAWDVYNNSSTAEIFFEVASSEQLTVQNVYNYPNPFQRETVFTFQHNQNVPIDVEIKVYTVAGRLIAELQEYSVTDRFVRIPWTGYDDDGDRLANGVYFYKVIARTADGEYTSEALGRLVVMR